MTMGNRWVFAKDPRTGKVAAIPEGSLVSFNVISRTLVSSDGHAVVLDPEAFEQVAGRLTRKGGWLTFLDAGGALNSGLRVSAVSSIDEESRTVRLGANVSFVLGPSPDGPDFQEVFEALTGAARERSGSPGAPCKPSRPRSPRWRATCAPASNRPSRLRLLRPLRFLRSAARL